MLCVTTFSAAGYDQYARNMMESFAEYGPCKLVAFAESPLPTIAENIEVRNFFDVKDASRFLERIKRVSGSDGLGAGTYDFRFDCARFCRKVFAQDAVLDEDDEVFWLDADTILKQPLPAEVLRDTIAGVPVAFLGRKHSYSETGFIGFNTADPMFPDFRSRYLTYFTSGDIFKQLEGWHDCIAFDHARRGHGRNLTPHGYGFGEVIQASPLGPYIDHLKGNRKLEAA